MGARMFISLALVLMVSAAGRPARAQDAAPPPPASPHAWTDHARVGINVLEQPSSGAFNSTTTKPVYLESAVFNTTYGVPSGMAFDGGILVRVAGNFGVGVAVSSFTKQQDAAVTGTAPHPFFYNTSRSISGTAQSLRRNELVAHIQAAYVVIAGKLDVAVSGGPSFFSVKQDLVSDVTFADSYPYDSATFTTASSTKVSATRVGFNAGVDVGVRLSTNVGVGGLVRFSKVSLAFPLAGSASNVTADAGGIQAGGGLRLFF